MKPSESARKILETLRHGQNFICLRDLARASGFQNAHSVIFKDGLNLLIEKGIIKLEQSGWRSENRGYHHPKVVILLADLFEFDDLDMEIPIDKLPSALMFKPIKNREKITVKPLSAEITKKLKTCRNCRRTPMVFITPELIPVCKKHWYLISDQNIQWGSI